MSRQSSSNNLGNAYYNTEEGSFGVLNFRDLGISSADNAENKKYDNVIQRHLTELFLGM